MVMQDERIKTTLEHAEEYFNAAQEGLYKPEEDVVHYTVCRNAFKAVESYLTSYLIQHGKDIHSSMSIEEMIERCRGIDPKFNNLDLAPLFSSSIPEDTYMDMKTATEFMDLAKKTRETVG